MILVEVAAIALDPKINQPVLLLKPKDNTRLLPIPLGQPEAMSIMAALQNVELARPMTHDLMVSCFEAAELDVIEVRVVNLHEGIFYAEILLDTPSGVHTIDARPSDAIALALRVDANIYVADSIFNMASVESETITIQEDGMEDISRNLPGSLRDSLEGSLFDFMNEHNIGTGSKSSAPSGLRKSSISPEEVDTLRALIDFADPDDFDF